MRRQSADYQYKKQKKRPSKATTYPFHTSTKIHQICILQYLAFIAKIEDWVSLRSGSYFECAGLYDKDRTVLIIFVGVYLFIHFLSFSLWHLFAHHGMHPPTNDWDWLFNSVPYGLSFLFFLALYRWIFQTSPFFDLVSKSFQWPLLLLNFLAGTLLWFVLQRLIMGTSACLEPAFSLNSNFHLLGIGIMVYVKTFFEELIFRGFLPKFVFRVSQSLILTWVLPAAVFAAIHLDSFNAIDQSTILLFVYYFITGMILQAFAVRNNGLESPFAFHSSHNLSVYLITRYCQEPISVFITPTIFARELLLLLSCTAIFSVIFHQKRSAIHK